MKIRFILLLFLFLIACKSNNKSQIETKALHRKNDSFVSNVKKNPIEKSIIKHAFMAIKDSCDIDIEHLDLNNYFDNINFPIEKTKVVADTFIGNISDDILIFEKCDYIIFEQLEEIKKGLDVSGYISDYGFINSYRVVLIWIEYPCQNRATLVTFKNNKLIDQLEIANRSCQIIPCDILYNNDSILVNSYANKAVFLSLDTIGISREWEFIKKNIHTKEEIREVGEFERSIYTIDSSGIFKFQKKSGDRKEYVDSIWSCV